ncbi:limonoid UDP-glucosyltransferase-like [Lathyrus oleraceus]|uniref:limonoid UDP-glucosyltransferase-like n=1 Tax=Pisum sativum TaxID=3888 RepID=UPI0021D22401|nr:limonoid UDP-glucosyltransferase-like [Pisum sativum]
MKFQVPIHILLVSFPAQGHINPLLRLAKSLAAKGISVIFTTTAKAGKTMQTANYVTIGDGSLSFQFFDDGLPDDESINLLAHCEEVELVGRKFVSQMIKNHADSNKPISCIINNSFFPWVSDVALEHDIPSALLWTNSSAVFTVCYNYVHKLVPFPTDEEPYIDVELPFLALKYNEIPDFIHPFFPYPSLGKLISEPLRDLSKVFCVFVDTYEELEYDFIEYISENSIPIRPIGPLFINPAIKGATSIDDCETVEWLNRKPKGSVVYVSFGTVVNHTQEQVHEIAYGILNSQVSFLWAIKQHEDLPNGFLEETCGIGKVVKWCSQEEVLAHPSVGCFITHCGWNSSMEALASGVPVLAFPVWGDQLTNAKFLVDVFGIGIRLGCDGKKLVKRDEVKKCLLEAMAGEKAEELKQNGSKWKKTAENAVAAGGSSDRHIDAFIEDIKKLAC